MIWNIFSLGFFLQRETHGNRGALIDLAGHVDGAAQLPDHPVDHRQTQARAGLIPAVRRLRLSRRAQGRRGRPSRRRASVPGAEGRQQSQRPRVPVRSAC